MSWTVRRLNQGGHTVLRTIWTLIFIAVAIPAQTEPLTLSTKYDAVGTNPDGSKYTGTAAVTVISNVTFTIIWTIGGSVIRGFGMLMNDSLSATYMINGEPGLVIYKVDANGTLDGLWAIRGKNANGTERLIPRD
jgi:hypothetical protein